jgi:hypothetical protein
MHYLFYVYMSIHLSGYVWVFMIKCYAVLHGVICVNCVRVWQRERELRMKAMESEEGTTEEKVNLFAMGWGRDGKGLPRMGAQAVQYTRDKEQGSSVARLYCVCCVLC